MYPKRPIIYADHKTNRLRAGTYNRKGELADWGCVFINGEYVWIKALPDGSLCGSTDAQVKPFRLEVGRSRPGGYTEVRESVSEFAIEVDGLGPLPLVQASYLSSRAERERAERRKLYYDKPIGPHLPTYRQWLPYMTSMGAEWAEGILPTRHRLRGKMMRHREGARQNALWEYATALYRALWGNSGDSFGALPHDFVWKPYLDDAYALWHRQARLKALAYLALRVGV